MNPASMTKRTALGITALLLINAALLVCAVCVGAAGIHPLEALRSLMPGGEGTTRTIVLEIRLPRALAALIAGSGLAVAGAVMQGLFNNPLSDPHLLGVSSGSALGASAGIVMGLSGFGGVQAMAFAGGLASALAAYRLARVSGRTSPTSLILAGVSLSALFSAINSLLMILNRDKLEHIMLWTMGSFTFATWSKLMWMAPLALMGIAAAMGAARQLNIMLLGDEEARSLGLNVPRTRMILIAVSTLTTSAIVAATGVIGFVGLMVPHAVRLVTGADYRAVLPMSMLGGGALLLLMDTLARTIAAPLEIPVGILTAALGAPFFLFLMHRRRL